MSVLEKCQSTSELSRGHEVKAKIELETGISSNAGTSFQFTLPTLPHGHEMWGAMERTGSWIQAAEMRLSLGDGTRSSDIQRELLLLLHVRDRERDHSGGSGCLLGAFHWRFSRYIHTERLYISFSLGTLWTPPGRAGKCWREERLHYLPSPQPISRWVFLKHPLNNGFLIDSSYSSC